MTSQFLNSVCESNWNDKDEQKCHFLIEKFFFSQKDAFVSDDAFKSRLVGAIIFQIDLPNVEKWTCKRRINTNFDFGVISVLSLFFQTLFFKLKTVKCS